MGPTTSHFGPNQSSLDQHWTADMSATCRPSATLSPPHAGQDWAEGAKQIREALLAEGVGAKKKKKSVWGGWTLYYITQQAPGGGGVEKCHGNAMRKKLPWQHHSNCGLICSLVVWYSPDLLQWHGRQIHTSVTSARVNIVHELVHQLIGHHRHHHHRQQQQSVRRSKNTVSTGLCFFAKWVTDRGVSRW